MPKIFISHASEDKETVAMPLAERLRQRGLDVWLDQWELTGGDSLRRSIEKALSRASFGIVIVSPAYMRKMWPNRELDGLFALETMDRKMILPVLHNIRHDELMREWPMFGDRLSCSTDRGLDVVADQITMAVHRASSDRPEEQPPDAVLSEYRRRMLLAAGRRDLRQILYELEDFLRHFPAHPQARLLQDDILTALRYEEQPPVARAPLAYRRASIFLILVMLALLGGSLYLLYKLVRYWFGL
jgi:hypothetical protein